MSKITEQEVRKIAAMSSIDIPNEQMNGLITQLEDVLTYAARVIEIAGDTNELSTKNVNVFREDTHVSFDANRIMQEAPQEESHYFVVPKIVDKC